MIKSSLFILVSLFIFMSTFYADDIAAQQYDLCLDPGHGGDDPGTIGIRSNGDTILEKDINLQVALATKHRLDNEYPGMYQYFLTRSKDTTISPAARARMANDSNSYALISVHHTRTRNS